MPIDFGLDLQMLPGELDGDALSFYRRALSALSPAFSTVWFNDHFQFGDRAVLESWTVLTFLAAEFPRLKVGNLVLGQSYRNPALLAKMGATLQYLTGGRFILGIGAGWHAEEQRAYGYEVVRPRQRVTQLEEAIEIIRKLWTGGPVTYRGTHYRIEDAYCLPRPDPMIPIMVGSSGPRGLRVTARLADAWNANGDMDRFKPPYDMLRRYCDEIGRDFREITLTAGAPASFPADPGDFVPSPPGEPQTLGPTPADAVEQLRPLAELGVTHFQIRMTDLRTIELFGAEVAPVLAQYQGTL
ncbi:MAG TPA: LLM class flavin-dependent oxidoreductase [Chloroflexota bacterium]